MKSVCTPRLPLARSLFGQRQSFDDVSFASLPRPSWGETCFLAGVVVRKLPEAQPWWWTHHALGVQLPTAGGPVESRVRVRCECLPSASKWDCSSHDRINMFLQKFK